MRIFNSSNKSKDTQEVALTITTPTFVKTVLLIIATVVILAVLRQASHALFLIFIAVFLALALNAPVHWLSVHMPGKLKGNRTAGTTISFLIVVVLLSAFLISVLPPIIKQTETFISNVPSLIDSARDTNTGIGQFVDKYNLQPRIDDISNELSSRLQSIGSAAFSTIGDVGNSVFAVLTVLALTFMMLIEGPRWGKLIHSLLPKNRQPMVTRLSGEMYKVIKGFVNGQVTLAAIAAIMLLPAMLVLNISYPIALVFVVFICALIPMVGHFIGATIVTLVALFESPTSALLILLFYILYQQIENYVIQPRVQANSTNMSPLLVFMAVVVGVNFNGLIGGLVAIPIAGCIRILVLEYLSNNNLIKDPVLAAEADQIIESETK